jgi:LEA14-like dessication related protein
MRLSTSFALLLAIVGGTSCASAPKGPPFYYPMIGLRDVRFGGAGVTGGSLELTVNVYNPNDYQIYSPRFVYGVYVGDERVARGVTDVDVVIPSRDSVSVRLPASFSYVGLGAAGRTMMSTGSVNYRVLGRMYASTPSGRREAPYDRAGWFSPMGAVMRR